MGFLFVFNVGEISTYRRLVDYQAKHIDKKCVVGSAIFKLRGPYKRELIDKRNPKIIALGSSRVLQFREEFFEESFVNAGIAMNSIAEGISFSSEIFPKNKPELMIIGIDMWWFNKAYQNPDIEYEPYNERTLIPTFPELLLPYKWLLGGLLSPLQFIKGVFGVFDTCGMGVPGRLYKTGYGPDGSYYYTNSVTEVTSDSEVQPFQDTLNRIKIGNDRFQYGEKSDAVHVRRFLEFLIRVKKNSKKVVLFFPPFSGLVNDHMSSMSDEYQYIIHLKQELKRNQVSFYDYSDVGSIGANDCEFVNGFHAGDVVYARIIKAIYESDPDIRRFINIEYIEEATSSSSGLAFIPDKKITSRSETDFLNLGCKKT